MAMKIKGVRLMTYTINGKEYTELDINKRSAELMGMAVKLSIDKKHWLLPSSIKNSGGYNEYSPSSNPQDAWQIIEKCWDELNRFVPNGITMVSKWRDITDKHNCSKLIAACICFIEM